MVDKAHPCLEGRTGQVTPEAAATLPAATGLTILTHAATPATLAGAPSRQGANHQKDEEGAS